jgi:hypothetical protein|tara:strand:+ start:272 stop:556 length:285 start_codon:yes stop_codon:yes gene_type:complete
MDILRVGDLIRWKNPLYIVENGREKQVATWHHAIVTDISGGIRPFDKPEGAYLTLMLIGVSHSGRRLELPAEMFFEIGQIQKSAFGKWVCTAGI